MMGTLPGMNRSPHLRTDDQQPKPAAVRLPEITHTDCAKCGTEIAGLMGLYACPLCGWCNSHESAHYALPTAEADPGATERDNPLGS